ncbi:MAG: toll/interleukin-1 receptor domain-containing protein [Nitrosomonadales bacterium]|nr:toll/interleukin-1 receptor domain-containing protein [Nitrosomonadales bacterium]
MSKKLFISYSRKDGPFAERLAQDLMTSGLDVWIDRWKLKPGESLVDAIGDAIGRSDYFLPVISPDFLMSQFAKRELNEALMRQFARKRAHVVPVFYRTCRMPSLLNSILWADFRKSYASGLEQLAPALNLELPSHDLIILNELATVTISDCGDRFSVSHSYQIEVTKPGITEMVELKVYGNKRPESVTVNSGTPVVESITGLHRIITTFAKPLTVRRPIRRTISYEGRGGPFDSDGSWFWNLASSFTWSRARIRFAPGCRKPRTFRVVTEFDAIERPGPEWRARTQDGWTTYTIDVTPEMAKWRNLRFYWD